MFNSFSLNSLPPPLSSLSPLASLYFFLLYNPSTLNSLSFILPVISSIVHFYPSFHPISLLYHLLLPFIYFVFPYNPSTLNSLSFILPVVSSIVHFFPSFHPISLLSHLLLPFYFFILSCHPFSISSFPYSTYCSSFLF